MNRTGRPEAVRCSADFRAANQQHVRQPALVSWVGYKKSVALLP